MKKEKNINWTICLECQGSGKKRRRIRKKVKIAYQKALDAIERNNNQGIVPVRPKSTLYTCLNCNGSGLLPSERHPIIDNENYPHVAIIGGGIGGVALAVGCLQRGIPFTLFERDRNFEARSQGYGLTLQQASKAIHGFGISALDDGVISTRHVVHTTDGKIIGEWGMRKWMQSDTNSFNKRTNVHIARQSLRLELLEQLGGQDTVQWNHQFLNFKDLGKEGISLNFKVDGKLKQVKADLVVGADGIRSTVRRHLIGDEISPLNYLGCIVILGICPLNVLKEVDTDLLDGATVFQTANGNERIYIMPYNSDSVMWQLSFPMAEEAAKLLSSQGPLALKVEACRRTPWHAPIPEILTATQAGQISGYPVYDRELLKAEVLQKEEKVTLIGDAAHPMSPFKGQGANQALLDALELSRRLFKGCNPRSEWRTVGIRNSVLTAFESEMLKRCASKVKDSAKAAQFLHSNVVLHKGDEPRGRCLKETKTQ